MSWFLWCICLSPEHHLAICSWFPAPQPSLVFFDGPGSSFYSLSFIDILQSENIIIGHFELSEFLSFSELHV